MVKNTNIARKGPTPEQLEYEELTKRMRLSTAKLRIAQEGVDVSSLSQQKLDMIIRTFDDMEQIQKDSQQKTSKIQQDANIQIQKINQDTGKKFADIQKKYQDLIKSLKENYPQEIQEEKIVQEEQTMPEIRAEPVIEDAKEKSHEKKVAEITDILLKAMNKKAEEILRITKTEETIGKVVGAEIIGGENPNDKEIPIITPEMMKKTEEEIVKKREEMGE